MVCVPAPEKETLAESRTALPAALRTLAGREKVASVVSAVEVFPAMAAEAVLEDIRPETIAGLVTEAHAW